MAVSACDCGLDDAVLADFEARDVGAELCDNAGELVAQRDGDGVVGAGVGGCGCEGRATEVFVKIGAADAYVRRCDLLSVCQNLLHLYGCV